MNSATALRTLVEHMSAQRDVLIQAAALAGGSALVVVVGLGGGLIVLARAQGWLGLERSRRYATMGLTVMLVFWTLPLVVGLAILSATTLRAVDVVVPAFIDTPIETEMGYLLLSPALAVAQDDPVVNQAARAGHGSEIPGRQWGNPDRAAFPMAWLLEPAIQDRVFDQMTSARMLAMGQRGRKTLLSALETPLPRAWVGGMFEYVHRTLTEDKTVFMDLMAHLHTNSQGQLSYREAADQAARRFLEEHLDTITRAILIDTVVLTLLVAWTPFLLALALLILALRPRINERFPVHRPILR